MIIPIRCMSCGKVLADKWRYYQEQVKKDKNSNDRYYFDGTSESREATPEKKHMDALNIKRPCCRKHFLTQIDLMEHI